MNIDLLIVAGILTLAIVLFASDKIRLDFVAIGVILALMLTGILTPKEALAGFSASIVILIAALFVVGEGLTSTGIAFRLGDKLLDLSGRSEVRLLIWLTLGVAILSAFMSSTGAVAIFIPVALRMCVRLGLSPGRLLMPISFGALIGGMLTLIGTPPNMVVSNQLAEAGYEPFGFFDFTPIGLAILTLTLVYMIFIGRRLLPDSDTAKTAEKRTLRHMLDVYAVPDHLAQVRITDLSPLAGQTISEANLRDGHGLTLLGRRHHHRYNGDHVIPAKPGQRLMAGDVYLASINPDSTDAYDTLGLVVEPLEDRWLDCMAREIGVADLVITPQSRFVGQTVTEAALRRRYGVNVLALQPAGSSDKPLAAFSDQTLGSGDALLVCGAWKDIESLRQKTSDVVVLSLPEEVSSVAPTQHKAPLALGILLVMLIMMASGLVPTVAAALAAALAMVLSGVVPANRLYPSVQWPTLVLIAAMLPMATALTKTGGVLLAADSLVSLAGPLGPFALIAGLFVITAGFSQIISNTATSVLVAPIALTAAQAMQVSPYATLMVVAIAASAAFATPVASPVNTLVLAPGRYKFMDFVRVGLPLQVMVMILTLVLAPLLF